MFQTCSGDLRVFVLCRDDAFSIYMQVNLGYAHFTSELRMGMLTVMLRLLLISVSFHNNIGMFGQLFLSAGFFLNDYCFYSVYLQ